MTASIVRDTVSVPSTYVIHSRFPQFRVYRKGKLKAVASAKELQSLFGIRYRDLNIKLLKQAQEPDDIQLQLPYQVELESEYQISVEAERLFAIEIADEINRDYEGKPSVSLAEQEAMAQPNSEELLAQLRKRNNPARRYRNRRLLSERLLGGMLAPETDTVTMPDGEQVEVVFGSELDASAYLKREEETAQRCAGRSLGGGIDRATRKTNVELEHEQRRNEKYNRTRTSLWY